jgi:hypothetical protein
VDKNELRYFLTEAVGECCPKFFKEYGYHKQIDFLTWEGFGKLWEWTASQDWYDDFHDDYITRQGGYSAFNLINPEILAKAVADYLQKK